MDALEQLFTSSTQARLLKLFLMNPEAQFSIATLGAQLKTRSRALTHEVQRLLRIGVVKSGHARRFNVSRRGARKKQSKYERVFFVNKEFPLFVELRNLMLKSAPHAKGQLAGKIRRLGTVKLAILAGVFIDNPTSRVDLFLVGEGLKKVRLKALIQWLEAHIGKELRYVAMPLAEFKYRVDMYDRFVRDILEFPHETVINKLGV